MQGFFIFILYSAIIVVLITYYKYDLTIKKNMIV